jgi:hypothetical protein
VVAAAHQEATRAKEKLVRRSSKAIDQTTTKRAVW